LNQLRILGRHHDLSIDFCKLENSSAIQFEFALLALALNPRLFKRDLFALGKFTRLHFDFVDVSASCDLALFDLFLVLDSRFRQVAFLNEFRLFDLLARSQQSLLAFLVANGTIAGEFEALGGAAHFDVVLLRKPRIFAFSVDIERLALGVEILGPDFDLSALLNFVAHASAGFDRLGKLGEPFRVEGVELSKNSRFV
jgi:hypothetical protein